MKIRNGFVSNSSSSSFVILKSQLTDKQLDMVRNHIEEAKKYNSISELDKYGDPPFPYLEEWGIEEDEISLFIWTTMDNFDMFRFMKEVVKFDAYENGMFHGDSWDTERPIEYYAFKKEYTRRLKLKQIIKNIK